jgi:hypothetical protein
VGSRLRTPATPYSRRPPRCTASDAGARPHTCTRLFCCTRRVPVPAVATAYAPLLMQYCRCGVPAGLRAKVWLGALRLGPVAERDYNYYATLQREVARVQLATDAMVKKDAAAPSREEDYFVFAEVRRRAEGSGERKEAGERESGASAWCILLRVPPLCPPLCVYVCVCVCVLSPAFPPSLLSLSFSLSVCVCVCPSMFLPRLPPAQLIEEILLAFCRDPALPQRSASPRPSPLIARNKNGQKCAFPPNGVPPFKGLADFVCPLCFVYAQPTEVCTPVPGP